MVEASIDALDRLAPNDERNLMTRPPKAGARPVRIDNLGENKMPVDSRSVDVEYGFKSVPFADAKSGKLFAFIKGDALTWGMRCFVKEHGRQFLLDLRGPLIIEDRTNDSVDVGLVDDARLAFEAKDIVACGPSEPSVKTEGHLLVNGSNVYVYACFQDFGRPRRMIWVNFKSGEMMLSGISDEGSRALVVVSKWKFVDRHWPHRPALLERV